MRHSKIGRRWQRWVKSAVGDRSKRAAHVAAGPMRAKFVQKNAIRPASGAARGMTWWTWSPRGLGIHEGVDRNIKRAFERRRAAVSATELLAEVQMQIGWAYFPFSSGLTTWRAQSMKSPANGLMVRFFTIMIPTAVR